MKYLLRCLLFSGLFILAVSIAAAQAACPDVVSQALTQLDRACSRLGRNQVCYGNLTLLAQPQPGVTDLHFATPGDIESITRIQSLVLNSMNEAVPEWGVSLMSLQASLPGVLPGQNVTFLLFGSAQFSRDDATAAAAGYGNGMQAFTFSSGIGDAHCGEAPDSGLLVQTNRGKAEVVFTVNGVQVWLSSTAYIQSVPGGSMLIYIVEGKATVSAFGVSRNVPAGTFVSVPVGGDNRAVAPPSEPQGYNTGVVQRLAPLLSALPRGIGLAPALDLSVCTLIPPANANTRQGPGIEFGRGTRIGASVPQQSTGTATDASGARWYQLASGAWVREDVVNTFGPCAALPVVVQQPAGSGGVPQGSVWTVTETITENTCDPDVLPVGLVRTSFPTLSFSEDRSVMTWDFGGGVTQSFSRIADNVYASGSPFGFQATMTITFTSPTTFTETWRSVGGNGCVFSHDSTGVLTG